MTGTGTRVPALDPRTRITQAGTSDSGWILEAPAGKRYRIGDDFARIALNMDGATSPEHILDRAPGQRAWRMEDITAVTQRLQEWDALVDEEKGAASAPSRLRRTGPLVFQFDLWRPTSVGSAARAVSRVLWSSAGIIAQVAIGVIGLAAFVANVGNVHDALAHPVSLTELLIIAGLVYATFPLHELAHAGAVISCGGMPRRFGVMLFYLMPAAYCDVTDVWLLAPRQRAKVLLAGLLSQFAIAGGLFLWGAAGGPVAVTTLAGCLLLLTCAVNLIPFVKLDGYLLVAALTTTPFLHRRATEAFLQDTAHVVSGTPPSTEATWIRLFGIGTTFTPILLTISVLGNLMLAFSSWGIFGQLLITALIGYVVGLFLKGMWRLAKEAHQGPKARLRLPAAIYALVAASVALLGTPVPATLTAAYVAPQGAEPYLVYQEGDSCLVPPAGAPVELSTNGLVAHTPIGAGVTTGQVTESTASALVSMPVEIDNPPLSAVYKQPIDADLPAGTSGSAVVHRGSQPLIKQLFNNVWRCFP